eukprot:418809-Rhodomonas_salina.1
MAPGRVVRILPFKDRIARIARNELPLLDVSTRKEALPRIANSAWPNAAPIQWKAVKALKISSDDVLSVTKSSPECVFTSAPVPSVLSCCLVGEDLAATPKPLGLRGVFDALEPDLAFLLARASTQECDRTRALRLGSRCSDCTVNAFALSSCSHSTITSRIRALSCGMAR